MDAKTFAHITNDYVVAVLQKLEIKNKTYSTDEDQLHNFRIASNLMGNTMREVLAGMMVKHTVSLYDMCLSGEEYDLDIWDSKIIDHINYLLLLAVILNEESELEDA